ncbi:VTT domain-containing protein [Mumia sp. zg.B53]|uniref:VTT domain-containing protein n=1 Tax=unclassified Mumia TaxID=2621872 RepID=UPI001C6EB041|nr:MULTISPECIES: VTT domain-containing protein [unclassified Mumia]MBW9210187.1 VTT domain-containing protein [Mumia sp. zg.B21]MBW9214799.1 VTT domain-containing protein [Mumia sp. zg.B53]MDD9371155.1 VTT domain-containing protein [Acidimicrobiales bacterium]
MDRPEGPALSVWLFFFVVVFLRAQATYWIARVATVQVLTRTHPAGGWRARTHDWLEGGSAQRGADVVRRWGALAVPVSFLTVGAQTVINAGAGVVRMPFPLYLVAMVPGCMAWALVWTTIGMSAFYAAVGAGLTTGWGVALAVVTVVGVVGAVVAVRRRSRART